MMADLDRYDHNSFEIRTPADFERLAPGRPRTPRQQYVDRELRLDQQIINGYAEKIAHAAVRTAEIKRGLQQLQAETLRSMLATNRAIADEGDPELQQAMDRYTKECIAESGKDTLNYGRAATILLFKQAGRDINPPPPAEGTTVWDAILGRRPYE